MLSTSRLLACLFAAIVILAACNSTTTVTRPPPACDDAKCAPGNQCLDLDGEIKCRKVCSSNSDPATSCPFGYTCIDTLTGAPPFCVKDQALRSDGTPLEKKPSGQWGASCQANLGLENPDCDTEQDFYCYGISPTDGDAYCTRYGCESDEECGAGFWCATVNTTPSVAREKRTKFGAVQRVCLRRSYCSPCVADVDCPDLAGRKQYCVSDKNGESFCAPTCEATSNCANEARCVDVGLESKVCYPRAKVCVGDGELCSPCHSDADCGEDGVCVKGQYTTEKACAKKAPSGDCELCPEKTSAPAAGIACTREASDNLPEAYCVGVYEFGKPVQTPDGPVQPFDLGCWTPKR